MNNSVTISDFIKTNYRNYWSYTNKNGKNSILPKEQLHEVVRKIIYASYSIGLKERHERKTVELKGEVSKYHAHGDSSIEDSIKGVATAYKSQPATRILEGVGNFGSAPGDDGAAGRYTSVSGTPLLTAIYKDIPFMPFSSEDTGLDQPEYISCPLPMSLINGMSPIGTGESCYLGERDAKEVIDWIKECNELKWEEDKCPLPPAPMCVTGCETYINNDNGYIYYDAVVHYGVDINNLEKNGKFDIITNLPPKSTPQNVIYKLQNKLPSEITNKIIDGSGKGRPTYIIVPTGYISEKDYAKYGMRLARKENILIWDEDNNTMRHSNIFNITKLWFDDRCNVVKKRLSKQMEDYEISNKKIDLIKEFVDNEMINWPYDDIVKYFTNKNKDTGADDASLVLNMSTRAFLPENLNKNQILKDKNNSEIKALKNKIKNVDKVVIEEAYSIIEAQNKFFS